MSKLRVVVDFEMCESNAVCCGIAPAVFELDDQDFLVIVQEHPAADQLAAVKQAVTRCPRQAISLVDDE